MGRQNQTLVLRDNGFMIAARALAVWLLLIFAEVVHGILRTLLLVPRVGQFRSNQIGVFTGSAIILAIAYACVPWIGARGRRQLLAIGAAWLILTLAFELSFGHWVAGRSWDLLAADYDVRRGDLLGFGMAVLALAPWLASRWRQY